MSKRERLAALTKRLKQELSGLDAIEACTLLQEFITVFKLKKNYEREGNWLIKGWYLMLGIPLIIKGYIRDVKLNQVVGPKLFPRSFVKFGPLTNTLIRVKESMEMSDGRFYHYDYGYISKEQVDMAYQICEVLRDYDKNHC